MSTRKKVFLVIFIMATIALFVIVGMNEKKYTYEELKAMPSEELLALFVDHGMDVDQDLKLAISEDEMAEIFRNEFDLMIQGTTSLNHGGYYEMAQDAQEIYDAIVIEE